MMNYLNQKNLLFYLDDAFFKIISQLLRSMQSLYHVDDYVIKPVYLFLELHITPHAL